MKRRRFIEKTSFGEFDIAKGTSFWDNYNLPEGVIKIF